MVRILVTTKAKSSMQSRIKPFPMCCNLSQRKKKTTIIYVSNSVALIISLQTKYITPAGRTTSTTPQCFQHYYYYYYYFYLWVLPHCIHLSLPGAYITPPHASTPFQSVFVFACPPSPPSSPPFSCSCACALAGDGVHFSFRPGAHHGCPGPQLLLWLR
jgi:hypothetical protein